MKIYEFYKVSSIFLNNIYLNLLNQPTTSIPFQTNSMIINT